MQHNNFGLHDRQWTDNEWKNMVYSLVETKLVSWTEIASLVLGHLNPPQVGTALASSEGFKKRYGKGNTMRVVMDWFYRQSGKCVDCGTRLELQADHKKPREEFANAFEADFIENMELRCRRCNVIRRPSHRHGGVTHLTAEAALMWILLTIRPRTYLDFVRLCRLYGMTMADVRMQEGWAMAHWLARSTPPAYYIEDDENGVYDLLLWPDNAVTRQPVGCDTPAHDGVSVLYSQVSGDKILGFITRETESDKARLRFYEYDISFIPFSIYDLGLRPGSDIAISYVAPDRAKGKPPALRPLPPRGREILAHSLRTPDQRFRLVYSSRGRQHSVILGEARRTGTNLRIRITDPSSLALCVDG